MADTEQPTPTPPTPVPVKPGSRTTEFAFGLLAAILTGLYASGVIPTQGSWATIAAIAAITLTALGYTVSRTILKKGAVMVLLVAAISTSSPACSHPPSKLKVAMVSLTTAADGFVAWDRAHQQGIVDKATSEADGQAKLGAYRAKRNTAILALQEAFRGIASAAVLKTDTTNALLLVRNALDALATLQGTP